MDRIIPIIMFLTTSVLVILKALGMTELTWWMVFVPLWGPVLFLMGFVLLAWVYYLIAKR